MSGKNSSRTTVIGLSGGVASGKNFVAEIFAKKGAAIFDADKEVHKLLQLDKSTIAEVKRKFPKSFVAGKIERKILGEIVLHDKEKLQILEKTLHAKVRENYQKFLKEAQKEKKKLVVLNIPLLHETDFYQCDKIIAILASPSVRKKRFLARARKNYSAENRKNFAADKKNLEKKFEQIIAKQLANQERKAVADFVINANFSKAKVTAQVTKLLRIFV